MAFEVPFGKKVRIPFSFLDANKQAAKVDGTPTISTTLGNVLETVEDGSGGFSALVDLGGVGLGTVTGLADVDLGAGVKELAFSLGDFVGLESPEATAVNVGTPTVE
jgi:hypothetical protein